MTHTTTPLEQQMSWEQIVEHTLNQIKVLGAKPSEKEFKKWMMSKEHLRLRAFDAALVYHAFKVYKKLHNDYDNWIVICGKEGSGKSTLAINLCLWISDKDSFKPENVIIDADQFNKQFREAKPTSSLLLDEGGALLFSRNAMSGDSKFVIQSAMVARAKCINMIVCIPNFFLLDTYIRNHRVDLLIHVTKRGVYKAFKEKSLAYISKDALKSKDVMSVRLKSGLWWDGKFRKNICEGFDYNIYLANKHKYIDEFLASKDAHPVGKVMIKAATLAKQLDISSLSLRHWIEDGKIRGKKMGQQWFVDRNDAERLLNPMESGFEGLKKTKEYKGTASIDTQIEKKEVE